MRNKFNAKKIEVDGHVFDSMAESNRYAQLKLLERARAIRALSLQPSFILTVNGHEICEFRGDFSYFENGRNVVEDSKGVVTREFRLKRKLFLALHPTIELRVVDRKGSVKTIRTRKAHRKAA